MSKGKGKSKPQGWGNPDPLSSRSKFHYFLPDGVSLCGKWANAFGRITLEDTNDDHADNCAACKKKIAAYRKTSTASVSAT
jgi:hypothetical protein